MCCTRAWYPRRPGYAGGVRAHADRLCSQPACAPAWLVLDTLASYVKLVANEPSVGMYFVQEHVRKSVPFVVATKASAAGSSALPVCAAKASHCRAAVSPSVTCIPTDPCA